MFLNLLSNFLTYVVPALTNERVAGLLESESAYAKLPLNITASSTERPHSQLVIYIDGACRAGYAWYGGILQQGNKIIFFWMGCIPNVKEATVAEAWAVYQAILYCHKYITQAGDPTTSLTTTTPIILC